MSSVKAKMDALSVFFKSKGYKSTNQRDYIASIFFRNNTHVSLDELLQKVRKKNPRIGYATVYRTMKLLTEGGFAVERNFGDGQTRFESIPKSGHHDHMICMKCARIEEFKNERIEKLQTEAARGFGFSVTSHKLEMYGYCRECSREI